MAHSLLTNARSFRSSFIKNAPRFARRSNLGKFTAITKSCGGSNMLDNIATVDHIKKSYILVGQCGAGSPPEGWSKSQNLEIAR
tara:strand:- start:108 stop:359 length:252 start_codon:yes stop_codon:yes gene_type:complete